MASPAGTRSRSRRSGTVGFLGNLSPAAPVLRSAVRSTERRALSRRLRFRAPRQFYESQTHVVWLDDRSLRHRDRSRAAGGSRCATSASARRSARTASRCLTRSSARRRPLPRLRRDGCRSTRPRTSSASSICETRHRAHRAAARDRVAPRHAPDARRLLRADAALHPAGRRLHRVRDRALQELPVRDRCPSRAA